MPPVAWALVAALVALAAWLVRRRAPPRERLGVTSLSGKPAPLPSAAARAPSNLGAAPASLDQLATYLPSRYTQARRIGAGGMGVVFQVEDSLLSRPLAIKMLSPALREDAEACARFVREARALAALNHPGVLTVYDAQPDPWPFIAMELLDGADLESRLAQGPFADEEFYRIALALLAALEHVHRAGFIHRDLKPANIFVRVDGTALIMDFGLAREERRPAPTAGVGTPLYMAPEQLEGGPVDLRTDLYAMGLVLHRMLAGRLPFPDDDPRARLAEAAISAPALGARRGPALAPILARALARDPAARYHAARDLATDRRAARARTANSPVR